MTAPARSPAAPPAVLTVLAVLTVALVIGLAVLVAGTGPVVPAVLLAGVLAAASTVALTTGVGL